MRAPLLIVEAPRNAHERHAYRALRDRGIAGTAAAEAVRALSLCESRFERVRVLARVGVPPIEWRTWLLEHWRTRCEGCDEALGRCDECLFDLNAGRAWCLGCAHHPKRAHLLRMEAV